MRIFLAGTPAMVIPLFDKILQSEIQICGVLTNSPKPRGRSGEPIPSPVSKWAKANNLLVFENENLSEVSSELAQSDLVFVVAYGKIIGEKFLNLPQKGWLNLHFSSLPEARGAAPVQRLIAAGKGEIGFTLFKLDSGMDTGPIYYQSKPISIDGMTTGEVWEKCITEASKEIVNKILEIGKGLPPISQHEFPLTGKIQLAPKISTSEARVDWMESAEIICRKILAFNPTPSAWSLFRGERVLLHRARVLENNSENSAAPGMITEINQSLLVRCNPGILEITMLQPAGKREMSSQEWLRGAKIHESERFE